MIDMNWETEPKAQSRLRAFVTDLLATLAFALILLTAYIGGAL